MLKPYLALGAFRQVWCDRCLTSAGVDVHIYGLLGMASPYQLGTLTFCSECDDPTEAAQDAITEIDRAIGGG